MPLSPFRAYDAPPHLAPYVSAAGLELVASEGEEAGPWGLMFARREGGVPFAAVRTQSLDATQVDRCIATAIAHSVLDHRGDFVHAPDGSALIATSRQEAVEAVRYGALLLER